MLLWRTEIRDIGFFANVSRREDLEKPMDGGEQGRGGGGKARKSVKIIAQYCG